MHRTNHTALYRTAQDAAFLWCRRAEILRSTRRHQDRVAVDQRLENLLDGLAGAGEVGQRVAFEAAGDSRLPGHAFVATYLELASPTHYENVSRPWLGGSGGATTFAEVVTAIGWTDPDVVGPRLRRWSDSSDASVASLGVAGLAAHRLAPGRALQRALRSEHPALRATAANAAGKLGAVGTLGVLRELVEDAHADVTLQAARSAARFSEDRDINHRLATMAERGDLRVAERAIVALAGLAASERVGLFKRWAAEPRTRRLAIVLAEVVGAPELVPQLILWMNDDELARRAGDAFVAITGIDLTEHGLTRTRPTLLPDDPTDTPAESLVALGPDHSVSFPAPLRVAAWWRAKGERLVSAGHYLNGLRIDRSEDMTANLLRIARAAPPRCQSLAADILSRGTPNGPSIEAHAPATWRHELPGWTRAASMRPIASRRRTSTGASR